MINPPPHQGTWLDRYIAIVGTRTLPDGLLEQQDITLSFLREMDTSLHGYRYAEGKWTVKEILAHFIETERIFNYRALRFARNDSTILPGWDENEYAKHSNANARDLEDLLNEYSSVRLSTYHLYSSFTPEMLDFSGTANNFKMTPRALLYATLGHEIHHLNIIRERYLNAQP